MGEKNGRDIKMLIVCNIDQISELILYIESIVSRSINVTPYMIYLRYT